MIIGAHAIVYSKDSEADRKFFQDVLGLSHVDAGGGWLIFGLPPAEVAVHPSKTSVAHELYLMTDDVAALSATLRKRGVYHTPPVDQRWGIIMHVTLPSGGKIAIYEPRHERPAAVSVPGAKKPAPASAKTPEKATEPSAAPAPPKTAALKSVPAKVAAAKVVPAKVAPAKVVPAKAAPAKSTPAKATKPAPAKPEKPSKKPTPKRR